MYRAQSRCQDPEASVATGEGMVVWQMECSDRGKSLRGNKTGRTEEDGAQRAGRREVEGGKGQVARNAVSLDQGLRTRRLPVVVRLEVMDPELSQSWDRMLVPLIPI